MVAPPRPARTPRPKVRLGQAGRPVSRGGSGKCDRSRTGNDLRPGCDDDAVPTLNDLARSHTSLAEADVEYLHSLVSDWQLLADLSFADLILWAPAKDGTGWRGTAPMRPTTGATPLHAHWG